MPAHMLNSYINHYTPVCAIKTKLDMSAEVIVVKLIFMLYYNCIPIDFGKSGQKKKKKNQI